MRRNELDYLLKTMLEGPASHAEGKKDISDINLTVGKPPQVELWGQLVPVECNPPLEKLTPFQTELIALNLVGGNYRLTEELLRQGYCDTSYSLSDIARFRVNVFSQRGNYSVVLRKLNMVIPSLSDLQLPPIFNDIAKEKTGLILVTGATGSGKSTSLAALLNEINESQHVHVITLEDPVEFVHPQKSGTFNQRELGTDFNSYPEGLRAALRQTPKIILVGEMRDRETVEIGLSAAETGHLVLSTLHTTDAGQTINRILGMFEQEEQEQVRHRLSESLRWVVSQRLVPKSGGGRQALLEIMGSNLRTKETIVMGETEGKTFYEIIEASYPFGWRTFDQTCIESFENGLIAEETSLQYCTKKGVVARKIDYIKKTRGESTASSSDLKMRPGRDAASSTSSSPGLIPGRLRLK